MAGQVNFKVLFIEKYMNLIIISLNYINTLY